MILSFKELSDQINFEIDENISNSFLKKVCKIAEVPFSGGGVIFVKKGTAETEISQLEKDNGGAGRTVIYLHLPKKTGGGVIVRDGKKIDSILSYYRIFIFPTNDIWQIKKALKIHKLKAFL